MVYELMAAIGNTPATGDTFPVKTLIIVAAVAALLIKRYIIFSAMREK